jgi:hypothetical protein
VESNKDEEEQSVNDWRAKTFELSNNDNDGEKDNN